MNIFTSVGSLNIKREVEINGRTLALSKIERILWFFMQWRVMGEQELEDNISEACKEADEKLGLSIDLLHTTLNRLLRRGLIVKAEGANFDDAIVNLFTSTRIKVIPHDCIHRHFYKKMIYKQIKNRKDRKAMLQLNKSEEIVRDALEKNPNTDEIIMDYCNCIVEENKTKAEKETIEKLQEVAKHEIIANTLTLFFKRRVMIESIKE